MNKPLWKSLTPAEWEQLWQHVTTCDFPETAAIWSDLGREAGFAQARQLLVDPHRRRRSGHLPRLSASCQAISAKGRASFPSSAALAAAAVPSIARLAIPCRIAAIRNRPYTM